MGTVPLAFLKKGDINAYEVFPPEIVEEIQKYYSGDYLWIPKPDRKNIEETTKAEEIQEEHS